MTTETFPEHRMTEALAEQARGQHHGNPLDNGNGHAQHHAKGRAQAPPTWRSNWCWPRRSCRLSVVRRSGGGRGGQNCGCGGGAVRSIVRINWQQHKRLRCG